MYRMNYIPPASDYIHALEILSGQNKITEMQEAILLTQYRSPNFTIPASELGRLLGCHTIEINNHYGRLGHMIADVLNLRPDLRETGGYRWWAVLSEGWTEKKKFQWKMYESVVQAIKTLGWETLNSTQIPEEIDPEKLLLIEGSVHQILVNAYERSLKARTKCIEHYGCICYVCGFSFSEVYGALGQGFIHVHHLKPLAEISETYVVDPIADLRPVCPNCHAMLHRKNPPLAIENLKELIRR